MSVKYHHQFFSSKDQVMDDIKDNGTWPTTYVSGPAEGPAVHWYADEIHAYIMEGETDFLDQQSGVRTPVGAGDKIVVPARTLHAEDSIKDRVVYILALPQPRLPDEFLAKEDPNDLK
jgi:mannose-6-phosphate isomerase-like protein (cupin superfamily)